MIKTEQTRLRIWRLKVLEQAAQSPRNVARACRHFGISRQAFYKWKKRYEAHGEAGLCDRPRTPHRSPRSTPREVVSKILYLRQTYHFGPGKIADYLKRFHRVSVARSSVHLMLGRHGLSRLPANQKHQPHQKRWQRYEKRQPGHRLQMDVKFLERIPGTRKRLYQFTAIDDCTRIRVLKVYDACNQNTAIRFADEVIRRLPFRIHVIQTDNRRGISVSIPLASRGRGHPPCLHPATDASSERRSGTIPSRRRPRVLSAAGQGWRDRRYSPVQRQASRVGELLQLRPSARGARWPNTIRTAPSEDESWSVTGVLGSYTSWGATSQSMSHRLAVDPADGHMILRRAVQIGGPQPAVLAAVE